jgi:hypothetical protein
MVVVGTRPFMSIGAPYGEEHGFTHDSEFFWAHTGLNLVVSELMDGGRTGWAVRM